MNRKFVLASIIGLVVSLSGLTPASACHYCGWRSAGYYPAYNTYYAPYSTYYSPYSTYYAPQTCCYSACPTNCCSSGCATGCCPTGCATGCCPTGCANGCASGCCATSGYRQTYYAQRSDSTRQTQTTGRPMPAPRATRPVQRAATSPQRPAVKKSAPVPSGPVAKNVRVRVASEELISADIKPIPPRVVERAPTRFTFGAVRTAAARKAIGVNSDWSAVP